MGKKKKGYQQTLDDIQNSKSQRTVISQTLHNSAKGVESNKVLPPITFEKFDLSFLQMIRDTAGVKEEQDQQTGDLDVRGMVDRLVESRSLLKLREDVQILSERSRGRFGEDGLVNLACFLFLGSQFSQLKKYTQQMLMSLDETKVLVTLENIIIEYVCSDSFEELAGNVYQIHALMRSFEYKLMAYFEVYHRIVEQNPLEEEQKKAVIKHQVQTDFITLVQQKICLLLSKQSSQYLSQKGFVMNSNSTKSLVEFLHAYLNFIGRFSSLLQIQHNLPGLDFISDALQNPLTNRDILTQCSILFWMILKISPSQISPQSLLPFLLSNSNLTALLLSQTTPTHQFPIHRGIIQVAKIRGFVLAFEKEVDMTQALFEKTLTLEEGEDHIQIDPAGFVLQNCEKNEGLQKVYSFHTLESVLSRLTSLPNSEWLQRVISLLLKNFEYPLHSISSCCESILRKLLGICSKDQIQIVLGRIKSINSKHEIKSKYLALGLALENLDSQQFLQENPRAIREMLLFCTETLVIGKYVLGFFEALLKRLWVDLKYQHEQWLNLWIKDYLLCLQSPDENIRQAVCQHITPIVTKINPLSLPFILSKYLFSLKEKPPSAISELSSLLTLLKIARTNKMLVICDQTRKIQLDPQMQEELERHGFEGEEFSLEEDDLVKLVVTQNWKMSLDCFSIVTMEQKVKTPNGEQLLPISEFEFRIASTFILSCTKTTFPEHRQNFMKAVRNFLFKIRNQLLKSIKSFVSGQQITPDVKMLVRFLHTVLDHCESNLYLDQPIDAALPLLEVMKMTQELFGDYEYQIKGTQILPPTFLLSKVGLLQSQKLIFFLLDGLRSSWSLVRSYSFDLLSHLPQNHPLFQDITFINENLLNQAFEQCNNPKAMVAEGAGLLFKLVFCKCLDKVDLIRELGVSEQRDKELGFLRLIVARIRERLGVFKVTLIKEGKTTALIHGLLSFLKHFFADFSLKRTDLSLEQFQQWRAFFSDLLNLCLEISDNLSVLLSNNRIQDDETQDIKVDCRGHPISNPETEIEGEQGDYNNLVLVGIWLAVKENGLTLQNLLRLLELPQSEDDDSKFLQEADVRSLGESLMRMLFEFKHRGAIEKAAENFSLLCNKLLCSNLAKFQAIPKDLLLRSFDRITHESHSTILRRSAGLPPTIIAILRAEPLSNNPELLNLTLDFLINLARTSTDTDDKKIHALNILRFIFQDSLLKHDIVKHITPAMILATENFQSDNWSIRNSTLMCFTSLTKRLLNTMMVQDQDLSRKKGLSIWEFVSKYKELSDYFKLKLRQLSKVEKDVEKPMRERQDMVIYSILLFISRLVPAFQLVDSQNYADEKQEDDEIDITLQETREQSMEEYIDLIKGFSSSSTYFVRKISAQAILPIQRFDQYLSEISGSISALSQKILDPKGCKMKQNEAHGHMIRIHTYLKAYFKYRELDRQLRGRSDEEEQELVTKQEQTLINSFDNFISQFDQSKQVLSPIILGLFLKSLRCLVKQSSNYSTQQITSLQSLFEDKLTKVIAEIQSEINEGRKQQSTERFIFLKDLIKSVLVFNTAKKSLNPLGVVKVLNLIDGSDFSSIILKAFNSKIKVIREGGHPNYEQFAKESLELLILKTLGMVREKSDEQFCKVLEFSLKGIFKVAKHSPHLLTLNRDLSETLESHLDFFRVRFPTNANVLAISIKIKSVFISNTSSSSQIQEITRIFRENAYSDKVELVRVANVKSICRVLQKIDLEQKIGDCTKLVAAILFVLNDEHPEIRFYMVQHSAAQKLVDKAVYTIQSKSLSVQGHFVVDLNEHVLIQSLLDQSLKLALNDSEESCRKMVEMLKEEFIDRNPYREHEDKNFEEKIFFFEPINKYYDLLTMRKAVSRRLQAIANSHPHLVKVSWSESERKDQRQTSWKLEVNY